MSTHKAAKPRERILQPWHIALFVIALAILGWRLFAYVGDVRRQADVKYDKGLAGQEYKNPARPGTATHRMFEEK